MLLALCHDADGQLAFYLAALGSWHSYKSMIPAVLGSRMPSLTVIWQWWHLINMVLALSLNQPPSESEIIVGIRQEWWLAAGKQ